MVRDFGITEKGEKASLYELRNANGMTVCVSDYGAAVVSVYVPGRDVTMKRGASRSGRPSGGLPTASGARSSR